MLGTTPMSSIIRANSHTSPAMASPSEQELANLVREMQKAFNLMEKSDKQEYEQARDIVPSIVASETPFLPFLRTESFDPRAASKRLALYWKKRKKHFGDRWLLPMTQTGRGALNSDDIALLRSGFLVMHRIGNVLWAVCDLCKPIAFFRKKGTIPRDIRDMIGRVQFYVVTVSACCGMEVFPLIRGTLVHVVTPQDERLPPLINTEQWDCILNAFPTKLDRFLVARAYNPQKVEVLDFACFQVGKVVSFCCGLPAEQFGGNSVGETVTNLDRGGLPRRLVPSELGGDWDYDLELANFTRMRLSLEDGMGASPPTALTTTTLINQTVPHELRAFAASRNPETQTAETAPSRDDKDAWQAFERKRRALYSRRTYHRRKLQLVSLQQQVDGLNSDKEKALAENIRLKALLDQARFAEMFLTSGAFPGQMPHT